jgi:hypothetical protein
MKDIILAILDFLAGILAGIAVTITVQKRRNTVKNKQSSKGDYSPNINTNGNIKQ